MRKQIKKKKRQQECSKIIFNICIKTTLMYKGKPKFTRKNSREKESQCSNHYFTVRGKKQGDRIQAEEDKKKQ